MTSQHQFFQDATTAFGFLTTDFGYRCAPPPSDRSLDSLHFEKPPLYVEIGWYKGEVSVMIGVTIDTSILRPYRPKCFHLPQVVAHLEPKARKNPPNLPSLAITNEGAAAYLIYYAALLKEYGAEILRGDIKALEEIVQKGLHPS